MSLSFANSSRVSLWALCLDLTGWSWVYLVWHWGRHTPLLWSPRFTHEHHTDLILSPLLKVSWLAKERGCPDFPAPLVLEGLRQLFSRLSTPLNLVQDKRDDAPTWETNQPSHKCGATHHWLEANTNHRWLRSLHWIGTAIEFAFVSRVAALSRSKGIYRSGLLPLLW